MEIRFPTGDDSPHYLATFIFSRAGDAMLIEVADQRNTHKCSTLVPLETFREAMATLGAVKIVDIGDPGAQPLGPREIDRGGF